MVSTGSAALHPWRHSCGPLRGHVLRCFSRSARVNAYRLTSPLIQLVIQNRTLSSFCRSGGAFFSGVRIICIMDKQFQSQSRAPLIIAIVLLLLPMLYVGSYLALVVPDGAFVATQASPSSVGGVQGYFLTYRAKNEWCSVIFHPLEWFDRSVFPDRWEIGDIMRFETRRSNW